MILILEMFLSLKMCSIKFPFPHYVYCRKRKYYILDITLVLLRNCQIFEYFIASLRFLVLNAVLIASNLKLNSN